MRLARAYGALVSALLAASTWAACGGDGTTKGTNSNTNWLLACETPADCEGEWDCLCGLCTATCEDTCAATGGVCTPADALAHGLQCGEALESAVCLRGCDDGGEACAEDQACVNGVCTARPEPSPCSEHPQAVFCSGFESSELDAGGLADGGEIAQTTEEALTGSGSLAAYVNDGGIRSRARYDFDAVTEGTLYLRTWLYLDVDDASALHLHTLTIGSVDTAMHGTDLHIEDGKLGLTFPVRGDVAGSVSVPARTWFCARMEMTLGATDGTARVWLNDELSAEAEGADTLPPEGVVNIAVGIDAAITDGVRMLVDDLVLATSPVGCDD